MSKTKAAATAAKKWWSESFGVYGATIRVAEREPGGVLYLLWLDNRGKQRKRSLGHCDRKQGKKQAMELAAAMAGASGRGVVVAAQPAKAAGEPLTLAEGVARAFDPERGMYTGRTPHAKQAKTLAERAVSILGSTYQTWADLTPGTILYLVRMLAKQSTGGKGARSAKYACVVLYSVAAWLRGEGLIPESAALPRQGWKAKLKEEWRVATGRRVECHQPRHTVDEVAAIFTALPEGDPRLRLLVELAAELRAGQAVRAKRSDLHLSGGGFGMGRFVVHGAGKKHGEVVDLHPELRALVDEVLSTGYLAEAEAAYRRGEIGNYFLFPAGKLHCGKARVERVTEQPLGPTAIRKMFVAVERIAGVEHVAGRAFYGLRRQATDLAPEFASDARVLNRLSGHLDSATRERVYQEKENQRVRARAAETRRSMRKHLREMERPEPLAA